MLKANRPSCVGIGIGFFVVFAALGIADDLSKKNDPAKDVAVPADLKNWKIEFDGFMDQPRQRPNFHVSLAHDGTMLVETWQGKEERRRLFDGKLTAEETRRFFDRAADVINGYERKNRDGRVGDGWDLSVQVSAKTFSKKASFTQQREPSDKVAPGFDAMLKIIRAKIPRSSWYPAFSNGSADRVDEEKKKLVPEDLKDWKIDFKGFAGTPGDRSSFWVSLAHDGTMLVEKQRVRNPRRKIFEGKLTEDEARTFFDGTVKVIDNYNDLKSRGRQQDGWRLDVELSGKGWVWKRISFEDQHQPSDEVAPGFDAILKVIRGKIRKGESFPE